MIRSLYYRDQSIQLQHQLADSLQNPPTIQRDQCRQAATIESNGTCSLSAVRICLLSGQNSRLLIDMKPVLDSVGDGWLQASLMMRDSSCDSFRRVAIGLLFTNKEK
jgi:hypothetical protein